MTIKFNFERSGVSTDRNHEKLNKNRPCQSNPCIRGYLAGNDYTSYGHL